LKGLRRKYLDGGDAGESGQYLLVTSPSWPRRTCVRTIIVDPRHDAIGVGSRRIARLSGLAPFFVIQIKSISSTRR